jgi:hypothetical protein
MKRAGFLFTAGLHGSDRFHHGVPPKTSMMKMNEIYGTYFTLTIRSGRAPPAASFNISGAIEAVSI